MVFRAYCTCGESSNPMNFISPKITIPTCICKEELERKWSPLPAALFYGLCCDQLRNRNLKLNRPIPILCSKGLCLPHENHGTLSWPRFILKYRQPPKIRYMTTFNMFGKYILICHISHFPQFLDALTTMCGECYFFKSQCQCKRKCKQGLARERIVLSRDNGRIVNEEEDPYMYKDRAIDVDVRRNMTPVIFTNVEVQSARLIVRANSTIPSEYEPYIKYLEDLITFFYLVKRSRNTMDVIVALTNFVRGVTGESVTVLAGYLVDMAKNEVFPTSQLQNSSSDWIDKLDDIYSLKERFSKTTLAKRFRAFFNHVLIQTLMYKAGLPVSKELADKIDKKVLEPNYGDWATLTDAFVGLLIMILKQGKQCVQLGTVEPIFLEESSINCWMAEVRRLSNDFLSLSNPESVGLSVHKWLYDVDAALVQGHTIQKYLKRDSIGFALADKARLNLIQLKRRYIQENVASALRKQPLGVVLYGSPGIGKTTLHDIIFNFDAKLHCRPTDESCKYVIPADSDHWNGFKSYKHTIILDDVAQHNPASIQGIDPTVECMLRVINNTAYCPPQAALEDKGMTPVLSDLVIITTNNPTMNLDLYYPCSYAPMRRVPYRVEPIVKPQYRQQGSNSLDSSKVPPGPYPDVWTFQVCKAVEVETEISGSRNTKKGSQVAPKTKGVYKYYKTFDNLKSFLEWYKGVSIEHHKQQELWLKNQGLYKDEVLCDKCNMPVNLCSLPCPNSKECGAQTQNHRIDMSCCNVDQQDLQVVLPKLEMLNIKVEHVPSRDGYTLFMNKDDFDAIKRAKFLDVRSLRKDLPLQTPKVMTVDEVNRIPESAITLSHIYYKGKRIFKGECYVRKLENILASCSHEFNKPLIHRILCNEKLTPWREIKLEELRFGDVSPMLKPKLFETSDPEKLDLTREYFRSEYPIMAAFKVHSVIILQDFYRYVEYKKLKGIEQVEEIESRSFLTRIGDFLVRMFVNFYLYATWFACMNEYFRRAGLLNVVVSRMYSRGLSKAELHSKIITIGIQRSFPKLFRQNVFVSNMLKLCSVVSVVGIATYVYRKTSVPPVEFSNKSIEAYDSDTGETDDEASEIDEDFTVIDKTKELSTKKGSVQTRLDDVGNFPKVAKEGKPNVWSFQKRELTPVDFGPACLKNGQGLTTIVANLCTIESYGCDDDGKMFKQVGVAIRISNEHLVTNLHNLVDADEYKLKFLFSPRKQANIIEYETVIDRRQVTAFPLRDLAIVKTRCCGTVYKKPQEQFLPVNFPENMSFNGYYLCMREGKMVKIEMCDIRKTVVDCLNLSNDGSKVRIQGAVWTARFKTKERTKYGDCGAPLIVQHAYGDVVVGLHTVYFTEEDYAMCISVSREDLKPYRSQYEIHTGSIPIDTSLLYEAPVGKSYIDYHTEGQVMYHGEIKGFRSRPKHHVFMTEICQQIAGLKIGDVTIEQKVFPPKMHSWIPQQICLENYLTPISGMKESIIDLCVDVFLKHIVDNLPDEEMDLLEVYNINVAVNGYPGMTYVDAIKRSTSMGFPWKKSKRYFLEPLESDIWQDGVKFKEEIVDIIREMHGRLEKGERCHFIFSSNLKDEPVSQKKVDSGKVRVFYSGPAPLLVLVRMYFLSFARVFQRNRGLFRSAVGMDPMSPEWDKLASVLLEFPNFLAGDYAFYDSKVKNFMTFAAMRFIIKLCEMSGNFSDLQIKVMYTLAHDLRNPTVDFFGALITFLNGEVSGHQLTTIFNCIINILYQMYAFYECGYNVENFFKETRSVVLGDDHVISVSDNCPNFNHTSIQQIMKDLGVDYTMADKDAESVAYIPFEDVTFLKRHFRFEPELGLYLGALDKNSIFKMVMVQVASKSIEREEQLAQAMLASNMESFFHGRDFFKQWNEILDNVQKSLALKIQESYFPRLTYEQNLERFLAKEATQAACHQSRNQNGEFPTSYCLDDCDTILQSRRVELDPNLARAFPESCFYRRLRLEAKHCVKEGSVELNYPPENKGLAKTNEEFNEKATAVPETENEISKTVENQEFVGETVPASLDMSLSHDSVASSQILQAHLAQYLSRPARIGGYNWTEGGSTLVASFQPWDLFFNTPAIKNKLESFSLLRCTLKVKFTVNASPFYYGALAAIYKPASGYNNSGYGLGTAAADTILWSQRPKVWLDPQTVSTAEMKLPFLYHKNWLQTLSRSDFQSMGTIDLVQFTDLRSANGAWTAGVNIIVYAWAEDVELSGPTSVGVLQSKKEYLPNGQVSGPASTIAKVARRLTDIPVIGPFAKATDVVASAVGSVAAFFGFTNVPVIRDVEPMKSLAFHTLASAHISEPIEKLSLQPKQEIAVDNSYLGDPMADPLLISNFCARESFLCGTLWSTSTAEDTKLFTTLVSPELFYEDSSVNPVTWSVWSTPMFHASRMFRYWRGDIIFRIKIVKSQYHRGRLNIAWDVGCVNAANMPSYGVPSVLNKLVDLEETDEVEIRVPYMQAYPFLDLNADPNSSSAPGMLWSNGPAPAFTGSLAAHNGMLQVRVVNKLSAPEQTSDVNILVFVRAAENIEFAAPRQLPLVTFGAVQSSKIYVDSDELVFNKPSDSDPNTYNEIFGEKIASFRELLHRSSKANVQPIPKNGDWSGNTMVATFPLWRIPRYYGYWGGGWELGESYLTPGTYKNFNYVRVHPINWLAPCFVGMKGSTNWTFNVINNDGKSSRITHHMSASRVAEDKAIFYKPATYAYGYNNSTSQLAKNLNNALSATWYDAGGAEGTAMTNQHTQAGLAVNFPYYLKEKMIYTDPYKMYTVDGTSAQLGCKTDRLVFTLKRGIVKDTPDADVAIETYCATGPDFNFVFFLNIPRYTYIPSPVAKSTE